MIRTVLKLMGLIAGGLASGVGIGFLTSTKRATVNYLKLTLQTNIPFNSFAVIGFYFYRNKK